MQFSNEQVKSGKGKKKSRPLKTDDQKSEKDQNRIDNTQSSTSGNNSQESLWESFNAEDYQRDTKGQYRPIPYNPHDRQYNFEENYDMREKEKSLSYRGNKKDPALHIHVPGSPVRVSYSPQNPMSNKPYYGHYMISPPESQEQYYHPTYQYSQYPPFSPGYESKSNSSMSYTDQRGNYNTSPKDSYQSGQRSPPRSARSQDPPDGYIYQVQFKRAHRNFILSPSAPHNLMPGDFVKVEADRGEDMGIILFKQHVDEFEEVMPTAGFRGRGFSSGQGEKKYIFRLASQDEKTSLVSKVADEEQALATIRYKVLERGLPMSVLDAEYQFDRHKLTFFFEAEKRIDFRELVSELFSLYKTRIWMQQVDTTALPAHDPGTELAKATGFLPERDEYSYIAPTILTPGGNSSITTSMNNTEDTARYAPLSSPHKENFGIKKETEKSRMRSSTEDNINHNISMEELNEMMTKTCVDRGVNKTPDNNKDF